MRRMWRFVFGSGGVQKAQRGFVFVVGVVVLVSFVIITTDILNPDSFRLLPLPSTSQGVKIKGNYFLDVDKLEEMGLLVNTSKCQIPNFSPWDPAMIPFIKKASLIQDCGATRYNWTFMDGNELVIKTKRMEEDGYSFENGSCCYKTVKRVEQDANNYDAKADNLISYSTCILISQVRTEILAEFIMVECSSSSFLGGVVEAYRGFHSIAYPQGSIRPETKDKLEYWQKSSDSSKYKNPLPNILILGIDSNSRLNFRRNMFKSQKILEDLGAIEMLGYTKVGMNTYPNFCPIFCGYSEEEIERTCYASTEDKQDDCPFIWKRLDAGNYLTAHTEDAPDYAIFNYLKTGFVRQPVDFYPRTLFQAAHDYGLPLHVKRTDHVDCIGHQTNDEVITSYVESVMDFAVRNQMPVFSLSWSTTLSHNNPNYVQLSDDTYAKLLQSLSDKGYLNNTILIFMGDHGFRFGPWRQTLVAYYEDKLPNFWIKLPPWITEKYPEWQEALEINSRRLTSPYTLYWTLNLLLDTFTNAKPVENSQDKKTGESIVRKYRQTFLEVVPESNTCDDVGVPEVYCACYPIQKVNLDDPILVDAALAATQKINQDLVRECATLKVSKITAGALMNKMSTALGSKKIRYVVGFVTLPGEFVFEAEIDYFPQNKTFSDNPNVERASRINTTDVRCVSDAKLELFCYCTS